MVDTNTEVEEAPFTFREDVRYFEGTVREELVLNPGDRIQLWTNDRRRTGINPKTGNPHNDGYLNVKLLRAGQDKATGMSRLITGLWSRLKKGN